MNYKLIHRITAALVFLISFVQFFTTIQPSVSFWDCGEFIAAAFSLQVPHPPGAPLFLILGRVFSMLPFGDNVAFRVNSISALSSVLSVLFLYLVAVKIIESIRGKQPKNLFDALITYISAAIGALSLSFGDTFWFNGVEAEVYASSTFLFTFIVWLMMIWREKADLPDNEKYLLMIAYLIGLSIGVHLMAVLAIVPVVMVILFRKYVQDDAECKKTAYIFLGHAALVLVVALAMWGGQTVPTPPMPEESKAFDMKFVLIMAGISAVYMAVFRKTIFTRNSFYTPLLIGGVALGVTYPGVVKMFPGVVAKIGANSITADFLIILILVGIVGYAIYWSVKNKKPTLNLVFTSFLFVFLGFTTYAMVIIRSNQEPPMNENEPNDFTELVSYLNREQYGDTPTFKRRHATEENQMGVYNNYSSDLDFWANYQMNKMFNRYLFWNYIGRESTVEDASADWSQLWGIPMLFGLIGIFYLFSKDWKLGSVFLVMFLFMGYLTAFYQNQQEPQPRERDYFYVGAFFVYSIWVALGVRGLIDMIAESVRKPMTVKIASAAILIAGVIFVPVRMYATNYHSHDRSKIYFPWDYAYNILQSCDKDAILFTYGDNDTFPLWYLQDVEGVRRDIRIVNLSLGQTPWYIKQLKHTTPYGTKEVPISMSDEAIAKIGPIRWEARSVSLPVPAHVYKDLGITDTAVVNQGKISWVLPNTAKFGDTPVLFNNDILARDIIFTNQWQRPIYYSMTVAPSYRIGLNDYLRLEGFAYRLTPEKENPNYPNINEKVMRKQLIDQNKSYSKDYQPGFKFRALTDSTIFYDATHTGYAQNYRNVFIQFAVYYLNGKKDRANAAAVLDKMQETIPINVFPIELPLIYQTALIYERAGYMDKYRLVAKELERQALAELEKNPANFSGNFNPYGLLIDMYKNLGEYNKAIGILKKVQAYYPDDPNLQRDVENLQRLAQRPDTSKTN